MTGMRKWLALLGGGLALAGCATAGVRPSTPATDLPPVRREFRGVWVASVANIDWPSRPGLTVAEQRTELLAILDRAVALNLNAIILQVRPAADALYASPHEPWSEYLTGVAGRGPEPGYDPLQLAVEESHRRGLELHAWFNPFRARHPSAQSPAAATHVSVTHPDWVRGYGRMLWMDPGVPEAREHSLRVMLDVVRRYDVDGIHIDDYFYPYPETDSAGRAVDFPDEPSWARYQASGGRLSRDDWRRDNVNRFVRDLYRGIKREKPWVKFGISPFGFYRPGYPPGIGTRFDQYAQLYADARLWLREGWMDYYTPQLYWPISRPDLSYPLLLRWWIGENVRGRHMIPGNFTSRTFEGAPTPWRAEEITDQIWVTRGMPGAHGNIHFSARAFSINRDSLSERVVAGPYREPALIPAATWLGRGRPGEPHVAIATADADSTRIEFRPGPGPEPRWWVVRVRRDAWAVHILPGWMRMLTLANHEGRAPSTVAVSAVDRLGNEGRAGVLRPND